MLSVATLHITSCSSHSIYPRDKGTKTGGQLFQTLPVIFMESTHLVLYEHASQSLMDQFERKNTFDLVTNMCVWFLVSPDMVSVTMLSLTSAKMWNLLFRWGHPQSCFCYCFSYGSNENGGWKIGSAAYHGPQTQGWRCILHIPRVLSLAEVKILNCEQKILHVHTHTHTCTRTRTHTHWG